MLAKPIAMMCTFDQKYAALTAIWITCWFFKVSLYSREKKESVTCTIVNSFPNLAQFRSAD